MAMAGRQVEPDRPRWRLSRPGTTFVSRCAETEASLSPLVGRAAAKGYNSPGVTAFPLPFHCRPLTSHCLSLTSRCLSTAFLLPSSEADCL